MIDYVTYALMAGDAYISTRPAINQFPVPQGWTGFNHRSLDSGFEAVTFTNGTEIVISYAGTGPGITNPDWAANIGLATGFGSDQLLQAAEYYLQVKAANPGANIVFTGHSLGGGLAALMGVFFGKQAVTFDQAPFANSAELNLLTPDVAANLRSDLAAKLDSNGNRIYSDSDLFGLTNFLQLRQANGGIPNSNLVTDINVQGEVLSSAPVTLYNRIGTQTDIANSANNVSGTDLHSQALLSAFLQSDQSAASGSNPQQTLSKVTFKLTDLLGMIFDKNLYYNDPNNKNNPQRNFLEHLVRHEAGIQGSFSADAMVDRFTRDLWKLAQDGGLTMNDGNGLPYTYSNWNNVSKALTAFAMQMYYEDTANATNASKELFTAVAGGIQFDMADVSKTFATAFQNNEKLNLNDAKGYKEYFAAYLSDNPHSFFTPEERGLITSLLPYLRDWYVQAGADIIFGGKDNDNCWRIAA